MHIDYNMRSRSLHFNLVELEDADYLHFRIQASFDAQQPPKSRLAPTDYTKVTIKTQFEKMVDLLVVISIFLLIICLTRIII